MARILLGITGGIAAYKACELLRLLVKAGHDVLPLPTQAADRFVRTETFFALARKSPSTDPYPHLERADLLVIAPPTRWRSSRRGSPTTFSPRLRSRTAGRCSSRRR